MSESCVVSLLFRRICIVVYRKYMDKYCEETKNKFLKVISNNGVDFFMFIFLDKRVFDRSCNRTFRDFYVFFRIVESILLFQLYRVIFTIKLNPARINKKGKF